MPLVGYRALLDVPGFRPLVGATLLGRLGGSMWQVALVLFVLQHYHSPALAGVVAMAGLLPGLLLSPIAGALLDRHGRVPMIALDYVVGAATGIAFWLLSTRGLLGVPLLVALAAISSLTLPLGATGARSLLPLIIRRQLWDRANGVDASIFRLASIAGPAAAGLCVAGVGGAATLAIIGLVWLAGAAVVLRVHEPRVPVEDRGHILDDAWQGLRYVLGNRVLRKIAVIWPVLNLGSGISAVAIPVLVLGRLHGGAPEVGLLYSVLGVAGLATNLVAGSMRTEGRERGIIAAFMALYAAGFAIVALAPAMPVAMAGMILAGAASGPADIAMFGLRQRACDPAQLGRAMSISMMLNAIGMPIGSALAGPVLSLGVTAALLGAAGSALAAAGLTWAGLAPRSDSASHPQPAAVLHP
jgi:hypothetical protein